MGFYDVIEQVMARLQRHGRVSYGALKRHFGLDDGYIEDLKTEILYVHPSVLDDPGKGLVWTGNPVASAPGVQRETDAESRFHTMLSAVIGLLRGEKRLTYRTLTHLLGLDEALMGEIREELALRRLAIDEAGKVLVWTGETPSITPVGGAISSPSSTTDTTAATFPAAPTLPPSVPETQTPVHEPTTPPEAMSLDALQDEPAVIPEPVRSAPEAERRQLTVMFCDLADSTKLSQQLDAEDLREVIRAYQTTAAAAMQQYEGHIAQYLGDGLLVYFGWPVAHEDDAQRALHAGLGIVDAIITQLNARLARDTGVQLAVRIGIHTGPVVVGEMGGGGRHENLATGETVNIAARLEGLAAPNTVVLSQVTARLVRGVFALEDLGAQDLKGVAEPMRVFRVLDVIVAPADDTVAVKVPFLVGRDEEQGLLVRRWQQSKEGLGQVVLVSGIAGIGKSGLVEVLRAQVRNDGLSRIAFRCSSYHQNSALYPVITHVERLLNVQHEDTPTTKLDKLERVLQTYSLPLDEVMPLFAGLLSVPLADRYAAPTLTPPQQKQHTLDALVAWMLEEAERQPVLVTWEDLHWADPSTLELLGMLLEQSPTVPMLSVLTFRPEFACPWAIRSHMTPITLNRLERPQVEALITHLAGGKALPAEVVDHIAIKADGVPLFVEELTRMLLASDLLRQEADQYVLTGPLVTMAIPDTLQDALMARLDQLHTAKEVAQLGAVLGREFAYALIQAISSQEEDMLQTGFSQLVEAELLYQRGRPPRARYVFKHALIQDTAYASLLRGTRQRVHQQIAQLLEGRFPETVETQPELVAHHYTEAGQFETAVPHWQQAGRHAMQRSAHLEAIAHFTRGVETLKMLPETPERIRQQIRLHITRSAALMAVHGYTAVEVGQALAQARALAEQIGDTSNLLRALWALWPAHLLRGEHQAAQEIAAQYFRLAQGTNEPLRLLQAYEALGGSAWFRGEFLAAQEYLTQGLALYDVRTHASQSALQDPGVDLRVYAALTLWHLGYPDQALQTINAAVHLARDLSHAFSLTVALNWASWLHQHRREPSIAQAHTAAALTCSAEQGFVFWSATGTVLQGWVQTVHGQDDAGLTILCQGINAYRATGGEGWLPYFLALRAEAYTVRGQPEAALATLTEALTIAQRNDERFYEAELWRLKGALLLQQSAQHTAQAETCFQQAIAIARQQQAKSWELRAAMSLARLWQQQDKRDAARELLAPLYNWFTEGFDTADLREAKELLAALT